MGRGAEDQSHREILAGPLTQKPGMIFFADTLFRSDSSSGPVCKELSLNNRILSLSLFFCPYLRHAELPRPGIEPMTEK